MILQAAHISYIVSGKKILSDTNIDFKPGRFHVIMGANGAGKSTLLKILAGSLHPTSGEVILSGKKIKKYSTKELAMHRAVLSQHYAIHFPLTASDIVQMGRYPYYKGSPSMQDLNICKDAMKLMEITDLASQDYSTLSGGEAQKVQMSRVLAQIWTDENNSERILFLDEPVSHLDIKYQHQLLKIAKTRCAENNTVIAVLHDINLAITYADRILFMKSGAVVAEINNPLDVSASLLHEIFDVEAEVIYPGDGKKPVVIF